MVVIRDKFTAVWISHSSISDYLKCPRLYYLKNIYRDPQTNRKVALMHPSLSIGQSVHEVIDAISRLPVEGRWNMPLEGLFDSAWKKVAGKSGGFYTQTAEEEAKTKAWDMLVRLAQHPGPLRNKAIKIRQDLPYYWLSDEDNLILCGKIDWLEYKEDSDSVHIIDFKTGRHDEDPDSLQLPIYYLLVKNCQNRPISAVSYWYLERDTEPIRMPLPDEERSQKVLLEIGKKIAVARKLEHFKCLKKDGCVFCWQYEAILSGKAEYVGKNEYGQKVFILPPE